MIYSYEQLLDFTPPSTSGGDVERAKHFTMRLGTALADPEQVAALSDAQRAYLYKLRKRWQLRADGQDRRWNIYGTRPGRPHKEGTSRIKTQHPNEEKTFDDLSLRVISKFRDIKPEPV